MLRRIAAVLILAAATLAAQTLGIAPNSIRTVLTSNVAISDTVINIAVCTLITPGILLNADNEIMTEISLTGTGPCAVTVSRGTLSTTVTAHRQNTIVSGYLTALTTNASTISSGTLSQNRGGAGNVNGIMKANGSGVVSAALPNTDYIAAFSGANGLAQTSNGTGGVGTPVTLAPSATTDTTNASNITSGILSAALLPTTFIKDLLFTDALYDIGKSGATRPRDGFFSRNFTVSGHTTFEGVTATGATGTGKQVYDTNPALAGFTVPSGTADSSTATHTLPAVKGLAASIPATCAIGEQYFATDAAAGRNLYYCTTLNAWTQQINGGASNPPGGAPGAWQFNVTNTTFGGVAITGDGSLPTSGVLTVSKINGTSIPVNSAADQIPLTTASATGTWTAVPNCPNGGLSYATSTHLFSCGTTTTIQTTTTTAGVTAPTGTVGTNWLTADATGGSYVVTLYTAVGHAGSVVNVKMLNSNTNTVTMGSTGGQTIDGALASTIVLTQQYSSLGMYSDGSNWFIF